MLRNARPAVTQESPLVNIDHIIWIHKTENLFNGSGKGYDYGRMRKIFRDP
jgi:hypothetical protein